MAGTHSTFQHVAVNGGTAVDLLVDSIGPYIWKNNISLKPVPGRFSIANDATTGLTEIDVLGHENPRITISGSINVDDIGSNEMTPDLLKAFARIQFTGTKGDVTGNTTGAIKVTIRTGLGATDTFIKDQSDTNSYFYAIIDSFTLTPDQGSDTQHLWRYTINLIETLTS